MKKTYNEFLALGAMEQRKEIAEVFKGLFPATDLRRLSKSDRKNVWYAYTTFDITAGEQKINELLNGKQSEPMPAPPALEPETVEPSARRTTVTEPEINIAPEAPVNTGGKSGNGEMKAFTDALSALMLKQAGNMDYEAVEKLVDSKLEHFSVPREIIVNTPDKMKRVNVGLQHRLFESILKLMSLKLNVLLVGPTGSGKTHCAEAVAKALGVEYYCQAVCAQTTEGKIVGYQTATGEYTAPPFYQAYKHGGLYLYDEIDAGNPNTLLVTNAALSNGSYRFPNGELVKRHPDFYFLAAGNTYGRGADRQFVGRNQLDASVLKRFKVLNFDYDEKLEKELALSVNPNALHWVKRVQHIRKKAHDLKERVIASPRDTIDGAKLLLDGFFTQDEIEEMCIWQGISEDIKRKIS